MPLFGPPNVEKLKAKRDVAGLVKALKSPNWEVRRNAATALGEIGDRQAVEALIASLQDPEGAVRHHAVVALGKLGDRRALPALRTMLFAVRLANKLDSSVETIIEALGSIGDRSVVQDLVPCLDDGYDRNVRATLKALGSIAAPSAIPPLLRYARTAPGSMRGPLADAFARIGAPAVEPLVASLAEKEGGWAASALAQIGAPAVGALLAASKSGQEVVQERAIRALVQIRPPAVDALLSAFESGKGPVRQRALEALAELGSQDDRVVEALATAFHADDDALRRLAAAGLARIPGRRTAELLTAALAGEDGAWRAEIARLLGNNKRGDTAAALFPLLHDPETRVRLSAIRGLPRVSRASKEERAALVSMLQEKDMQIRQASAEALASLGLAPTDPEGLAWFVNAREKAPLAQRASAVATLVGLGLALDDERLSSAMAELRAAAAMEVRTIVEHRVVDEDQWGRIHEPVWAVHRKLVEKREHHRSLLRTIVGKLEERRDTSQLIGALGDREVAIRDAAAGALGRLGDPSAVGPLIAALGAEGSGEAQDAMLDALQKLTGQDFEEAGLWSAWWQGQRGGGA